jgi:hypothetical protein
MGYLNTVQTCKLQIHMVTWRPMSYCSCGPHAHIYPKFGVKIITPSGDRSALWYLGLLYTVHQWGSPLFIMHFDVTL